MGSKRNMTMRDSKGLSRSVQKHEELYQDYHQKAKKRDYNADELAIKKNIEDYTF
jgi:predicted GTPase